MSCDEKEKLINDLRELREYLNQLKGMFAIVERHEKTAVAAKTKIESILFELTGDVFYLNKKPEGEMK